MGTSINFFILAIVLIQMYRFGSPAIYLANTITGGRVVQSDMIQHVGPDMNCTIYRQYQELWLLKDFSFCMRAVDIWEPLNELLGKQKSTHDCVASIINTMARLFSQSSQNQCTCTPGLFHLPSPTIHYTLPPSLVGKRSLTADSYHCMEQDFSFKEIYQQLYAHENPQHPSETVYVARSSSHHHIWSILSMVHHLDCRDQLIKDLADTYGYHHGQANYICTPVHHSHTVQSPITESHTTTSTSTTHPSSSSAMTIQTASCEGSQITYGIEHGVILSPSSNCPSKVYQSEQVIMAYCTAPRETMAWKPGPKVMDMCQSLPSYTAVATFISGNFDPLRDIAGVFVGCTGTDTGFKVAIALCNSTTSIEDVSEYNSPFLHSPDSYHIIVS